MEVEVHSSKITCYHHLIHACTCIHIICMFYSCRSTSNTYLHAYIYSNLVWSMYLAAWMYVHTVGGDGPTGGGRGPVVVTMNFKRFIYDPHKKMYQN